MSCRRKCGQSPNIYVRPVKGGGSSSSTVVGMSYVKLANILEVPHSPIKLNPANEPLFLLKLVGGVAFVLRRTLVKGLLQIVGTYQCIPKPLGKLEGADCMNTNRMRTYDGGVIGGCDCNVDRQQRSGQNFGDDVVMHLIRLTVTIYCPMEHRRKRRFFK